MKNLIIAIFAIATVSMFSSCEASGDPGYDGPCTTCGGGQGGVGGGGNVGGGNGGGGQVYPMEMYVWDLLTDRNYWPLDDSDADLTADDGLGFSEGLQVFTKVNDFIYQYRASGQPGTPGAIVNVVPGTYNPMTGLTQMKVVSWSPVVVN
jgi:hypothetical protein